MIKESSKIEEWKDIPSFEGLYQASSFGRIKAVERTTHYSNGKVVAWTDSDKRQFEKEMWDKCNSYIHDLME